jgi:hypothetical protein
MSNIEREVLAAALLGYWGRPRNGQHGPADWTPRQYEVMAEALEASGLPDQLRGAVKELRALFEEADYQAQREYPTPERLREALLRADAWLTANGGQ